MDILHKNLSILLLSEICSIFNDKQQLRAY